MKIQKFIELCKERGLCAVYDTKHCVIKIPTAQELEDC